MFSKRIVTKKFIRNDILEIIEILNCIENG